MHATTTTRRSLRLIRPRFTVAELSAIFAVVGFLLTTGGAHGAIVRHNRAVPILMYHVIADAPDGAAYGNLFVRPDDFAAQMRWLATHGYRAVTLHRVYEYWQHGLPLPARPVVLTFDDGTMGQHVHALPVLRALHWPGVLNLKVNALSSPLSLPDWRVRALLAAGWELDAHSLTHPDLPRLDDAEIWRQVYGSRVELQQEFHVPVDFFCYPAGKYDARVVNAVQLAGFLGATATKYGLARPQDLYTLSRIRIDGVDGLGGFAAKLQSLTP
jgi:peptidoglycan/xylan/chitin deacetylase (PgdA/CDA1 family)